MSYTPGRGLIAIAFVALVVVGASVASAQQTPFTVVVLPDTQYYTQTDANNNLYFKGQTNWIVANRQSMNIQFMMHLGDIQNNGNPYYANGQPTPWVLVWLVCPGPSVVTSGR